MSFPSTPGRRQAACRFGILDTLPQEPGPRDILCLRFCESDRGQVETAAAHPADFVEKVDTRREREQGDWWGFPVYSSKAGAHQHISGGENGPPVPFREQGQFGPCAS